MSYCTAKRFQAVTQVQLLERMLDYERSKPEPYRMIIESLESRLTVAQAILVAIGDCGD